MRFRIAIQLHGRIRYAILLYCYILHIPQRTNELIMTNEMTKYCKTNDVKRKKTAYFVYCYNLRLHDVMSTNRAKMKTFEISRKCFL
jgi:hypothetical protein